MKKIISFILTLIIFSLCALSSFALDINESEKRVFENDDTTLPYRLILPETYDDSKTYPLLVFLHGAGERGNDNELQFKNCVQNIANKLAECIILAPQCPVDEQWVDTPWANGAYSIENVPESNELKALMQLLDSLQEEFSIDRDRIYTSGLSMGGFGSWDLMMRHNDYFAAGIIVCGGGDVSQAEALKDTPLFVFHGNADGTVPVSGSKNVVQAIKDAGGELVTYVEYDQADHGIWNTAFEHEGLFTQLLTYKLTDRYPDIFKEEEPVSSEISSEISSDIVESEPVSSETSSDDVVSDVTSSEITVDKDDKGFDFAFLIPVIAAVVIAVAVVVLVVKKKK